MRAGADIVIQSLHKTLPSLTQTALAHVNDSRIDFATFLRSKNIFETSSPSYLLMASCDGCAHLLGEQPELIASWGSRMDAFYAATRPAFAGCGDSPPTVAPAFLHTIRVKLSSQPGAPLCLARH